MPSSLKTTNRLQMRKDSSRINLKLMLLMAWALLNSNSEIKTQLPPPRNQTCNQTSTTNPVHMSKLKVVTIASNNRLSLSRFDLIIKIHTKIALLIASNQDHNNNISPKRLLEIKEIQRHLGIITI